MHKIKKIYEAVEAKNPGKNELKPYPSSAHGWTAARGDVSVLASYRDGMLMIQLKTEEGKKEYTEAYQDMVNFFNKHL